MHLEHDTRVTVSLVPLLGVTSSVGPVEFIEPPLPSWGAAAAAAAVIAAFNTVVKGGLIPQARQGGIVVALAVEGSKFDGIGLEKVHIGQIHVALTGVGADGFKHGREVCARVGWDLDGPMPLELEPFFGGLGCNVIFGADFRKPAWYSALSISLKSIATECLRGSSTAT